MIFVLPKPGNSPNIVSLMGYHCDYPLIFKLYWPKNTSSGSWLKHSVRIIPSLLSRNLMSSFSECTKKIQNSLSIYPSE